MCVSPFNLVHQKNSIISSPFLREAHFVNLKHNKYCSAIYLFPVFSPILHNSLLSYDPFNDVKEATEDIDFSEE